MARATPYTPEEEQYLQDNYKTMNNAELGQKLGRAEASIANKLFKLGLRRLKKQPGARTRAALQKRQPPKEAPVAPVIERQEKSMDDCFANPIMVVSIKDGVLVDGIHRVWPGRKVGQHGGPCS